MTINTNKLNLALLLIASIVIYKPAQAAKKFPPLPNLSFTQAAKNQVELKINLGNSWKTYGKNPGATGIAPKFDWSKSVNLKNAVVDFPTPKRHKVFGGTLLGYRNKLILPIFITAKDKDKPVQLNLKLFYAVCDRVCVPLEEQLTLTLSP